MPHYSNDPRWITARFNSHCSRCGNAILKGETTFYYPSSKTLLCESDDCGQQACRDFIAATFDEDMFNA